jgi:lipopolysaccharide export LptBFGC system permease protein LptF
MLGPFVLIFFISLAALGLEQSLRLTNVLVEQGGPPGPIIRMLLAILPEYCGQALQLSFFFGTLIGFRAMARDNSLVAFQTAGQPFHRIVRPVMLLSGLASVLFLVVAGSLQPRGEFLFARTGYLLASGAFGAPLRAGHWLQLDSQTGVLAKKIDRKTQALDGVFIEQRRADGGVVATSAMRGRLIRMPPGSNYRLALKTGRQLIIGATGERIGQLDFNSLDLSLNGAEIERFRAPGIRAKESGLDDLIHHALAKAQPAGAETRSKYVLRLAALAANGFAFPFLALAASALGAMSCNRRRDFTLFAGAALYIPFVQVIGAAEHSDLSPLVSIAPAYTALSLTAILLARSAGNPFQNSLRRKTPTVRGRSGVSC